jgi:aldehyde:ferredoxin oxidoreductase
MQLKKQTIEDLKKIMAADYGADLNEEELTTLGSTLLRLTRIATAALARAGEKKNSSIQAREITPLEPKTSKE